MSGTRFKNNGQHDPQQAYQQYDQFQNYQQQNYQPNYQQQSYQPQGYGYQTQQPQGYQPRQQFSRNNNYHKLKTDRSLIKYLVLTLITFGIYGIWQFTEIGNCLNTIATKHDGRKTTNYVAIFFLGLITFGIVPIIWMHLTSERIGNELRRRGIPSNFSAVTFWLWDILGTLIVIGPFVYMYKLLQSMNDLCSDYNARGY